MHKTIALNDNYSTTRNLIKANPETISALVNLSKNPEDKLDTVMFPPEGENRQGEGGLRTEGYFKDRCIFNKNTSKTSSVSNQASAKNDIDKKNKSLKPIVSVVTVVYNCEKHLEETILSVINQTYDSVEYIIIDGGSTDGTLDIIKKYEDKIDYWVSEKDKGIYDAMNKGIKTANGSYLNFMNAGDFYYNNKVLEDIFIKLPLNYFGVLYGNTQVYYSKTFSRNIKHNSKLVFIKGLPFCHQSTFVRTSILKDNLFSLDFKIYSDLYLFGTLFEKNIVFKYIDIYISKYEYNGLSSVKSFKHFKELIVIQRKLHGKIFYSNLLFIFFKAMLKRLLPFPLLKFLIRIKR